MTPETFGFGRALAMLQSGRRVARAGWEAAWLVEVRPMGEKHPRFGVVTYGVCGVPGLRPLPWIGMKTAAGEFVPWTPGQADSQAHDWIEVE